MTKRINYKKNKNKNKNKNPKSLLGFLLKSGLLHIKRKGKKKILSNPQNLLQFVKLYQQIFFIFKLNNSVSLFFV